MRNLIIFSVQEEAKVDHTTALSFSSRHAKLSQEGGIVDVGNATMNICSTETFGFLGMFAKPSLAPLASTSSSHLLALCKANLSS